MRRTAIALLSAVLAATPIACADVPLPPPDTSGLPTAVATSADAVIAAAAPATPTPMATPEPTPEPTSRRVRGLLIGNQEWSGEVIVTGDVAVQGDLTIRPGTTVRFLVQDDLGLGREIPPDGHNDRDPTRLAQYAQTHSDIFIFGRLMAVGAPTLPITFTSASPEPRLADWQGLGFRGDGSLLQYVVVEWSRNGVTPQGSQPSSILQHSVIRHAMWGCVSSGGSGMQILDNEIGDCGHEGIDINGGAAVVRGNKISDSYGGIVVLEGSPTIEDNVITAVGDGIAVLPPARTKAKIGKNEILLAAPGTKREWRYGDFAYRLFEQP